MEDFLDLQIDDLELPEFDSDQDTKPMGSAPAGLKPLDPSSRCYFCNAPNRGDLKRLSGGQPICAQCRRTFL